MAVKGVGDAARRLNADHKHGFRLRQLTADVVERLPAGQLVNVFYRFQLQG
ncbi:hypothetical protein D3C80_1956110 [compost metagenome]